MKKCNSCRNKPICKVNEDISNSYNKYRNILMMDISDCMYFTDKNNKVNNKIIPLKKEEDNISDNINSKMDSIMDKMLENGIDNFNTGEKKKSKMIPEKVLDKLDKKKIVIDGIEKNLYSCPECGTKDYSDGLFYCEECGKLVCKNCGVFDNSLQKFLCEECW